MRKALLTATVALGALGAPTVAHAAICDDLGEVLDMLHKRHGERVIVNRATPDGTVITTTANFATGSWTDLRVIKPEGMETQACILAMGSGLMLNYVNLGPEA